MNNQLENIFNEINKICNNNPTIITANPALPPRTQGVDVETKVNSLLVSKQKSNIVFINNKVTIKTHPKEDRAWCDFIIKYYNTTLQKYVEVPVDTKADALNNKHGNGSGPASIAYLFTNLSVSECKKVNRTNILCKILSNLDLTNNREYFYLVINKSNYTDNFWLNMQNIPQIALKPNSCNKPFQCNWNMCRNLSFKSKLEGYKSIMKITDDSYLADILKNRKLEIDRNNLKLKEQSMGIHI